jgi:hypothetical protein
MSAETGPRTSGRAAIRGAEGTLAHTGAAVPLLGQAPPVAQPRLAASEWQVSCPETAALSAAT